jgi:hypothetical protein
MKDTFKTSAAYVSGGICGNLWMPKAPAGFPIRANARGPWGFFDRFTDPASFRDALGTLLRERGGDFRNPRFTADTVLRVDRVKVTAPGVYSVHTWEREISALPDCADLVSADAFTADLIGED